MCYTASEKAGIDEVRAVFQEHLRQCPDYELLWSDKVGYVWLAIGLEPLYVDTGRRIESAEDLCRECLESIGMDVLYGNLLWHSCPSFIIFAVRSSTMKNDSWSATLAEVPISARAAEGIAGIYLLFQR